MTWKLKIYPPNGTGAPREFTQAGESGVRNGFAWQLTPYGDNVQLRFAGKNAHLQVGPRDVIRLEVDNQPAFFGVVTRPPNPRSKNGEEFTVVGGREVLRRAQMDGKEYVNAGIYSIVRDIAGRLLAGRAVTYDATLVGNGTGTDAGPLLSRYYAPTSSLLDVMDGLAKAAGDVPWGVDAQGRFFFARPAPAALTVAYDAHQLAWLPVDGDDAVTKAILRIASSPTSNVNPYTYRSGNVFQVLGYVPATITKEATGPTHATYLAEAAVTPPVGVAVTKPYQTAPTSSFQMTNPGNVVDGDPSTYASNTGATAQWVMTSTTNRVIGLRIRYTLAEGHDGAYALLRNRAPYDGGDFVYDDFHCPLQPATTMREVTFIAPPSTITLARGIDTTVLVITTGGGALAADGFRLYEASMVVVDETAAASVAASFLREPALVPTQLTLQGIVAPSPSVTITNAPGGTVSGPTGLFEYRYERGSGLGGRSTLVRLGSTGQGAEARTIRLQTQRTAALAAEGVRAYLERQP